MSIRAFCVVVGLVGVGCGEVARGGQLPDAGELDGGEPDAAPVACEVAGDCASANPRGCNVDTCEDNTCGVVERHDGPDFVVDPIFSAETNVSSGAGVPIKVMWDGTNFVVVYSSAVGFGIKHVSPAGQVLDAQPALLDPRFVDIAPYPGGFLVATLEPPVDPYLYDHLSLHQINTTGAVTAQKTVALYDTGSNCPANTTPNVVLPSLATSGNAWFLTGMVQCGFLVRGVFSTGAPTINWDVTLYRPRHQRATGGPAGFAIIAEENRIGGGANEPWVQTFGPQGASMSGYSNKEPHEFGFEECCVHNLGMATGANGHMMAFTRADNSMMSFRTMDRTGAMQGTAASFPGAYPRYTPPAMGFDGKNYLVVPDGVDPTLKGYRISEQSSVLDATPIALSPSDAAIESAPQLGSDGAGLYAIAYVKSTDNNVYVRTFATCP
jgi:hypothetical protein